VAQAFQLVADYQPNGDQPSAIALLIKGLDKKYSHQTLLGVTGSGKTFTIANIIQQQQRPALLLAPNKTLAAQLYSEMKHFFPHNSVEYFVSYYDYYQPEAYVPASDTYIEKDASVNAQIEQMRLSATKALMEQDNAIIVATVSAIYGLGDPEWYMKMLLHLVRGDQIDQRFTLNRLVALQYKRNDLVLERGCYRVHGETLDIFPADSEKDAVRISLFDDEIESIHWFDPLTGRLLRETPRLTIYPKTHYVTPESVLKDACIKIKKELQQRLIELRQADKLVEAQRLEQRTQFDLEMIKELGYCGGIENYSRYLSGRKPGEAPPTLFDYLPPDAILVVDESHVTIPQLGAMYRGDRARKENLVNFGFRLPSALDNRPLKFEEFERLASQVIFVSATPSSYEAEHSQQVVEQVVRPTGLLDPQLEIRPVSSQVDDVLSEIHRCVALKERVLITTLTKRMSEDLTDYLSDQQVKVRYLHSDVETVERVEIIRDLRLGVFDVLVGINLLREGLDLPEVSLVAIFDADKEGFLRSERSLIQTIGRAARNINGKAILYADKTTKAMQAAIDETERRRRKQHAYNQQHGIEPQGIKKIINDILETEKVVEDTQQPILSKFAVAETQAAYDGGLNDKQLGKLLVKLEKKMYEQAQNLEFEEAAQLRDQIHALKQRYFKSTI